MRPRTEAPTADEARARSSVTLSSVPDNPSLCAAASSSLTNSGLPPASSQHREQNSALAAGPSSARTSAATLAALSADSPTRCTEEWSAADPTRLAHPRGSPSRTLRITSIGDSSERGPRYASQDSDGRSTHCRSSTVSSSGACSARFTQSQYKPCIAAKSETGELPGARPSALAPARAGPARSRRRSPADADRTGCSSNWRTTENAMSASSSLPRARSDRNPRSPASRCTAARSSVLPIPGGPLMTATAPLPAWAFSSRAPSHASSASRSSSSGLGLAIATMSLIVIARLTVA